MHKKYIKVGGKLYGPYIYENKRVGQKVVTSYLGKSEEETKYGLKEFSVIFGIFILVSAVFIFRFGITGNAILDLQGEYNYNESLSGNLAVTLEVGDSLQKDSEIILQLTKENNVVAENILTLEQFMNGQLDIVEISSLIENCQNQTNEFNETIVVCDNQTITEYYYQTIGTYSREISELINYTFAEEGDYILTFSIPSEDVSAQNVLSVSAPALVEEKISILPIEENASVSPTVENVSLSQEPQDNSSIETAPVSEKVVGGEYGILSTPGSITECQILDTSGTYNLTQDAVNVSTCFTIIVNNVILDCQNNQIRYGNSTDFIEPTYGIYSNMSGSIIRNCRIKLGEKGTLSNKKYGIYFSGNLNGLIENNNISKNTAGIYLLSSNNTIVSNNTIDVRTGSCLSDPLGSGGIVISGGSENNITGNFIISSGSTCSGIQLRSNANNNNITSNSLVSCNRGIYISSSDVSDNIFINNTVNTSTIGAEIQGSRNIFDKNYFIIGSLGSGISLSSSSSSIFRNNTFISNATTGNTIWVDASSSANDIFTNTTFISSYGAVNFKDLNATGSFRVNKSSFDITSNLVSLSENNRTLINFMNRSATITLYKSSINSPFNARILRNGVKCSAPSCNVLTSLITETPIFNVTSWSSYSIVGDYNVSEGDLTEWRMFRRWLNHTAWDGVTFSTILGLNRASYATGGRIEYSSPAVANGYVYIGSGDKILYQLNASNVSQLIANYTTGGAIASSPAVVNGYVYIGSGDNNLYQLNASNVSQKIASYNTGGGLTLSSPTVANGYVYIARDGVFYQLNATNVSQMISSYNFGTFYSSSAAVANGYVYISSDDGMTVGSFVQLNASNVSQYIANYTFPGGGPIRSSPAVANGYVYFGITGGVVYQLNASDVSMLVASSSIGSSFSSPAVANGYVYVGNDMDTFYQLDANNISIQIASYTTAGYFDSSPAVANGYVYVGASNGIFQFNASNVSQLIAYDYSVGKIESSPAVAGGYIYFGSHNNKTYQLNATNISLNDADLTYPQFSNYYDNNAYLVGSGAGIFNVTITNTNGTVWLQI
ncbi:MAG: PQQ-binding-like beta-propeller repeat protein, partial [archaeon]|nr:PQQ-binding-like beta-propeller repeat protein [archaeon]